MNYKKKNIEKIYNYGLCTGCGTCVALCPNFAIELVKNKTKGIFIPKINDELCNNCGICFNACPGHSVNFNQFNNYFFNRVPEDIFLGNYLKCYTGYACDCNIRYSSSSGGLVTGLLCFALKQGIIDGALITRMKKDNPLEPDPFVARTKKEIIASATSKYCPVPLNIALREILNTDGKFAIVGLPCHIHGIRKAMMLNDKLGEELRRKIVILLGLFCGMSRSFLATENLLKNLNIRKEELEGISYRGGGWPGNMSIELKNGTIRSIPYPYSFDYGPIDFIYTPIRCLLCNDKVSKLSDISFGDAWFPEFKGNDNLGRSLIIARSDIGDKILQDAISKKKIELNEINSARVSLSAQKLLNKKKIEAHISLFKILGKKVPIYHQEMMKPKFKDIISVLLYHLSLHILSNYYLRRSFKYLIPYLQTVKRTIKKLQLKLAKDLS